MSETKRKADLYCKCKISEGEKKRIIKYRNLVTVLACEDCIRDIEA